MKNKKEKKQKKEKRQVFGIPSLTGVCLHRFHTWLTGATP